MKIETIFINIFDAVESIDWIDLQLSLRNFINPILNITRMSKNLIQRWFMTTFSEQAFLL
jgi:hypothetical protein